MRDKPLVSVVVNNYNYARFLGEAIDSALQQSYPRVEVVVVDDGSTDDSRKIIARYGDRVAPVLKENGGQASAFNAGFEASKGEIVIFLDADDMLLPEAVERIVGAWRPGLAKVQYLLEVVNEHGNRQGRTEPANPLMPSGDLRDLIFSVGAYAAAPTSGNAFSRDVLLEILPMPEEEWRISADGYLITLVPFFGEVLSLREELGLYREHGSNNYNWMVGKLDLQKIRDYLAQDMKKQALIEKLGNRMGVEVPGDLVLGIPFHTKARIASLRMAPELHPYSDRLAHLLLKGIGACWKHPGLTLRKRLLSSAWFVSVAASPRAILEPLINVGLVPARRPRLLDLVAVGGGSPRPWYAGTSRRSKRGRPEGERSVNESGGPSCRRDTHPALLTKYDYSDGKGG